MEPSGSATLPEVLVLAGPSTSQPLEMHESGRSRSVPLERELRPVLEREISGVGRDLRRQRSHREVPQLPVQLPVSGRTMGRHVSLGPGWELNREGEITYPSQASTSQMMLPPEVPAQYQGPGRQERVRCHAVADSFDRYALQDAILRREGSLQAYAEVLVSEFHRVGHDGAGQVLYFDFGVLVTWGLSKEIERYILREVVEPCMQGPLPPELREADRLHVVYTGAPRHGIENDSLALHYRYVDDPQIKLAISFALAQSTKLSVLEERARVLGRQLSRLPVAMAETGEIPTSEKQIMKHVGTLFQSMAAVHLLGRVLDTPDSITSAPDNIGSLYKSVFEYMEVAQRVALLNDRFSVMQELLDILRVHVQKSYYSLLEYAVMWLVGVCAVVGVSQLVALAFWKPPWRE